jgi:hypothetical protein
MQPPLGPWLANRCCCLPPYPEQSCLRLQDLRPGVLVLWTDFWQAVRCWQGGLGPGALLQLARAMGMTHESVRFLRWKNLRAQLGTDGGPAQMHAQLLQLVGSMRSHVAHNYDCVLFPMNARENHWVGVEMRPDSDLIHIYDSLRPSPLAWRQATFPKLAELAACLFGGEPKLYRVVEVEGVPQQPNLTDCALYMLSFLEARSKSPPLGVSTVHPVKRRELAGLARLLDAR